MIHFVKEYDYNNVTGTKLIKRAVTEIAIKVVLFNGRSSKDVNNNNNNNIDVNDVKTVTNN